jgi:hypothetical protein
LSSTHRGGRRASGTSTARSVLKEAGLSLDGEA